MHLPTVLARLLQGLVLAAVIGWGGAAQAVTPQAELASIELRRDDGELRLDFAARLTLSKVAEDALQRGVPVYFVAQATLYRSRWYWRDERIARVSRSWRLAYQPLTSSWRVALGGLSQGYATLPEALAAVSRSGGWKVADLSQIDPDSRHYLEFSYRLDTSQLPGPMQIGLGGQADWALGLERTLRLD